MNGVTLEELKVIIDAQTKPLREELAKVKTEMKSTTVEVTKQAKKIESVFSGVKKFLARLGISTVLYKIGKASITMARQVEASTQYVNRLMGESAQAFMRWGKQNALAFNMSQSEFIQYGATYSNLLSSFIKETKGVANYTTELLKASSIIASGTGRTMTDVMERIRSGLLGNTEAIEDLGINVNVAMLESTDAFRKFAGDRSWNQLDFQTQQQIRLFAILEQTTKKYGDSVLQNTNSRMAQLSAIMKDIALNIGNFLLPVLNAVLPPLIQIGTVIRDITGYTATFMQLLFGFTPSKPKSSGAVSDLNDSLSETIGTAEKASKALGGLMGIDELNVISASGNSSGSVGESFGGAGFDYGSMDNLFGEEPDTSGIKKAVDKVKKMLEGLKKSIKKAWDSEPVKAFLEAVETSGGLVLSFLKTLGTSLIKNASVTWESIEGNINQSLINISTLWTDFWTDIDNGLKIWGPKIISGVDGIFNSIWKDIIDPVIQIVVQMWTDFTGILVNVWEKHGSTLVNKIGEFVDKTVQLFQSIWDNIISPIVVPFLNMLSKVWDESIKGMLESIFEFIFDLHEAALEIYNEFIQPILMWITDKLGPVFSWLGENVASSVGRILKLFSDLSRSIINILDGIIKFISGVFTGNWEKAWEGVKQIFYNIISALATIFKKPINKIIDGINTFIGGLNKIKIPDWVPGVGGKGFNISQIPKLARGGIIDRATIGIVGEAGTEAVIPLENNTNGIEKIAKRLSAFMQYTSNDDVLDMLMTIINILNDIDFNPTFEIDGDVITKKTNKNNERKDLRTGFAY